jgi:isopenicillin-N N-acyltransferase like protein
VFRTLVLTSLLALAWTGGASAEEKSKIFPEAKFKGGELRVLSGVPVLVVQGTPEEMGEQFGELAVKPTKKLLGKINGFTKSLGIEGVFPYLLKAGAGMFKQFPEHHQKELEAVAKASGVDRDLLIFANCVVDLHKIGGCSTLIVEPNRSKTGSPLFGRNLDWPPFDDLPDYSLVVVYRGKGKHACACVTIPPVMGCISGMNDVGLSVTINEINRSKDGSDSLDTEGMPMLGLFRKILEECTTVAEAEKLLRANKRTSYFCLTVCDQKTGVVFETTPKTVAVRKPDLGVCCCTNHFLTDELSVTTKCSRYPKLEALQKGGDKLGVDEVIKGLHAVNQGPWTLQSMVFEPDARVLHLSYATGKPATGFPFKKLDLGPLFDQGWK